MRMKIQPMTIEYVPQVAALEKACFSTPWSEISIGSELQNQWAIWLLALEGDVLAGYLGVQYGPDGADIMTIATDPAFRGRGIGRTLISNITERLRNMGLKWLTLEVRPSNAAALGLYASLGFQEVGRRPRYYRDPVEDAVLMTLFFEEEEKSC